MLVLGQEKDIDEGDTLQSKPLKQQGANEIRANIVVSIAGLPELSYERLLADNMGVGLSFALSFEKIEDMKIRSIILPYYRIYFGKKKAAGFFIEGNTAIVAQKENIYSESTDKITNSSTNFGLGVTLGAKLLAGKGFLGEIYLGGGRLFGNSITGGYPRLGVSLGKRF